ncbi:MAG: DUF2809 domain-containing protein [Bacteroidota bacterium]
MPKTTFQRQLIYAAMAILTIVVGLFSRKPFIPDFIYPFLGDFLYAIMFYFIVATCLPEVSLARKVIFSVLICFSIEISQLIQADWLNQIRQTRIGGLILGFGFLWSDLIAYTLGGLVAGVIDKTVFSPSILQAE